MDATQANRALNLVDNSYHSVEALAALNTLYVQLQISPPPYPDPGTVRRRIKEAAEEVLKLDARTGH